jgi:gliding motility-associated-like protein
MRSFIAHLIFAVLLLSVIPSKAQMRFVENGKQWPSQVAFRTDIPGGKFYAEPHGFTIDLYNAETVASVFAAHGGNRTAMAPPATLDCHAYRVHFAESNPEPTLQGGKAFETLYNYYLGNNPEAWSTNLHAYAELRYTAIYPGIDLKLYSNGPLKYDFIVQPGADPTLIKLSYEGVTPKINKEGQLVLKTSVREVLESQPFAYQIIEGHITPVACAYSLSANVVSFALGAYDRSLSLVIDPELIFSTYSGSTADNFGYTAAYDAEGHLYAGSTVFGTGYPTSSGAYQASWAGGIGAGALAGTDIALSKFNLNGTAMLYSTYLGGSGDELPHSLVCDADGELYMLGTSGSANYPVLSTAFQTSFAGGSPTVLGGVGINYNLGCDIVVSRLSNNGTVMLGSTFAGGSENDGVNTATGLRFNYADEMRGEIELDDDGNVVVGSSTYSPDFPMAGGGFQNTKGAGQEGVVFRLNADLSNMLSSTFYGGSEADAIYSIDISEMGVLVGGGSRSTNLPSNGTPFQNTFGGGSADGFIANFENNLGGLTAMTYYGAATYDQVYFVERDQDGFPHIYGQTTAGGNTFISNAAYGVPNSGMLLSKFAPDLSSRVWSTVFGNGANTPNISPSAFSVDICNRIYLSGWGGIVNNQGSTNGLPVTPDALQSTTDGNDFYFLVMEGDASALSFASFFGGGSSAEHVDGGTSRFDRGGVIYQAVCAGCGSNDDFPIFPENAHSSTNNSFNCNLGVAKIDFDLPLLLADFEVSPACLPEPVEFANNSISASPATVFFWDFGDGTNSNQINPSHVYGAPGTYTASLVIFDPIACNVADTISVTFEVFQAVELDVETTLFSCTDTNFTITASSNGTATWYTWASDGALNEVLLQGPTDSIFSITTLSPLTLYLEAGIGPCAVTESITLYPPPIAQLGIGDTVLCSTEVFDVNLSTSGGNEFSNYNWQPEALVISGQGSTSATFAADESFTVVASAVSEFGCLATDSAQVEVYPIALQVPGDTLSCNEVPLSLTANSEGTATIFLWSTDPDFETVINASGDSTITVVPDTFTVYYIQVINELCSLIDSVGVSAFEIGTSINEPFLVCVGDTVLMTVTNDFPGAILTHLWEPADLIIAGQGSNAVLAIADGPITFTVLSSTLDGACSITLQSTVFTSDLGAIDIDASATPSILVPGASSQLAVKPVSDEYLYLWEPPTYLDNPLGSAATSTPAQSITYTVSVIDLGEVGACVKNAEVSITVVDFICGEPFIYVPNAFTPNSDGENDVLYVRGQNIANMTFSVYDRWGERVFYTTDQNLGWDGLYKGKPAAPAVFVYHLQVDCGDGQRHFQKGNVTLLR